MALANLNQKSGPNIFVTVGIFLMTLSQVLQHYNFGKEQRNKPQLFCSSGQFVPIRDTEAEL